MVTAEIVPNNGKYHHGAPEVQWTNIYKPSSHRYRMYTTNDNTRCQPRSLFPRHKLLHPRISRYVSRVSGHGGRHSTSAAIHNTTRCSTNIVTHLRIEQHIHYKIHSRLSVPNVAALFLIQVDWPTTYTANSVVRHLAKHSACIPPVFDPSPWPSSRAPCRYRFYSTTAVFTENLFQRSQSPWSRSMFSIPTLRKAKVMYI